jgi:hypothetical protein
MNIDPNHPNRKRPRQKPPSFGPKIPIVEPMIKGYGFVWMYRKTVLSLSIFPVIMALMAQYIGRTYFPTAPFSSAITQIPTEFVMGLTAMIAAVIAMRHFNAMSLQKDIAAVITKDRFLKLPEILGWVRPLRVAVVAYVFVSYILSGIFAAMSSLYNITPEDLQNLTPEESALLAEQNSTELFIILGLFVVMIWIMRYLWLPLVIVSKRPITETYKKIGGMEGSVIIGVLFLMILMTTMLGMSLVLSFTLPLFGITSAETLTNSALFVRDLLSNFALVISQFAFVGASIFALNEVDRKSN